MASFKTHRAEPKPKMAARFLADFMAASERARRSIIQGCKFRRIARLVQHEKARNAVGAYLRAGKTDPAWLTAKAEAFRDQMADDDFERDVLDNNADYVERFAKVAPGLALPQAQMTPPGDCPPITLGGLSVTVDICLRLNRTTRTNKVRVGAATLRYARSKPLPPEVGAWQSAFLMGYVEQDAQALNAEAEHKLCLTVDAWAGVYYPAPTDARRRFGDLEAACATISERWPNVPPPPGAIL